MPLPIHIPPSADKDGMEMRWGTNDRGFCDKQGSEKLQMEKKDVAVLKIRG